MIRGAWRGVERIDVVLAAGLGTACTAVVLVFPVWSSPLVPLGRPGQVVVTLLTGAALIWRRARPVASTLVIAGLAVLLPNPWAVLASLYAAGAHCRRRWWLWVLVPVVFAAWFVAGRGWAGFRLNDQVPALFAAVVVTLAGLYVGTRRTLLAAAHDRAERAERERSLLAEAARAEERTHLAAEMHDVVTHRVNLMVLQAGALGVRVADPEVRAAAEALRASGCQALAELRDLVGVLRSGADPAVPPPREEVREGVAALVEESRGVGVDVDLDERGDPEVLAPTVHRTVVRVVQESLTNARKHAPGAPVRVVLHYDAAGVTAAVTNGVADRVAGGSPVAGVAAELAAELTAAGGGTGLAGLRRRVEMVGGTLSAGPVETGFEVRAALPAFVPTREAV